MDYDDANRAFTQAFFACGTLTLTDAKPVLASIFSIVERRTVKPEEISQDDFNSMVSASNQALSPVDFEIRSTFRQDTRERIYALCNTTSDNLTQLATNYSADEIAYVKRLLDEIFESNNTERREALCIASKEAINLARMGRRDTQGATEDGTAQTKFNLTGHEAELLLSGLVADGWLEKSRAGFYALAPRGLMELRNWLVDTYNDPVDAEQDADQQTHQKIKFCHACREIVTKGQRCARRECPCRIHDVCTTNFFRVQRKQECPVCGTDWNGKQFVGERAITTSESYLRGKRRSGAFARREEEAQVVEEGEEEEEEEEEEVD